MILYELLVGALPFGSKSLRSGASWETKRIIREDDPPSPSARLSTIATKDTAQAEKIAKARKEAVASLAKTIKSELEWIPLKAMRKDRAERYDSAADLGRDILNYIEGRPLEAAPVSTSYRIRKYVRRNRVLVAGSAAVLAALVVGLGLATWQWRVASRARDEAIAAQEAEKQRTEELKQVSEFQAKMLRGIDMTTAGLDLMKDLRERFAAALEKSGVPEAERRSRADAFRAELVRVNATDAAAAMITGTILAPAIKAVDAQFKEQPLVDAQLRQALASLYEAIGVYEAAYPLQASALATRRSLLGEEHPDTISSISHMGLLLHSQGKPVEADPYLRESLEKFRRVLGEDHPDTVTAILYMSSVLLAQSKSAEAESLAREALEKSRRVLGRDHPTTVGAITSMSALAMVQGKFEEAKAYLREVLDMTQRMASDDPGNRLNASVGLGALLMSERKFAEAEPHFREALEENRRLHGEEHPSTIMMIGSMAKILQLQGKFAEAESLYREVLEKYRGLYGDEGVATVGAIGQMGSLFEAQGKLAEAEPFYREALARGRVTFGEEGERTLGMIQLMGWVLQRQGKLAEAEPYYREALEKNRRLFGEEHRNTLLALVGITLLLWDQGKFSDAEQYCRDALEMSRRVNGVEHRATLEMVDNLGVMLSEQKKFAEAEPYLREALEKSRQLDGADHPDTLSSVSNMGKLLQSQGRHQEAIDLFSPSEQAARKAFVGGVAVRLATFLTSLGRARVGLGYDAGQFELAEANLLEAHFIFHKARGESHKDTRASVQAMVDLYTAWDTAEPGKGYAPKVAQWKAKLDAAPAAPAKERRLPP